MFRVYGTDSVLKSVVRFLKSDTGVVIPMAALLFPLIIGMAGLGVDVSNWMSAKRHMQTATDAAALAGAWELANGGSNASAEAAALKEAIKNGYDPSIGTLTVEIEDDINDDCYGNDLDHDHYHDDDDDGDGDDNDGAGDECGMRKVRVNITEKTDLWFSAYFLSNDVYTGTMAEAEEMNDGKFCVLGLDQTAIGAVEATGSVTLNSAGCGIAVNSNSNQALSLSGNVTINIGEVKIVGDYDIGGGAANFNYTKLRSNSSVTMDPYYDLEVQPHTACTLAQQQAGPSTYNADVTLDPGTYCGGITITGNTVVTMNPGTYVMDGGDFNVSGSGSILGEGVTIVLTNSGGMVYGVYGDIDITGGRDIRLSAPTTGYYMGVAIYQDRNAPVGTTYNKITGSTGLEVEGVVYVPQRRLDFGGNGRSIASGDPLCTKLIARQVLFHGNPSLSNDCQASGTRSIGNASAKLVL